jgi:hypothetical protein
MDFNNNSQQLLGAIKSSKIQDSKHPEETILDSKGAFTVNTPLNPIVEQTGSAYTAQNNILVNNIPHEPDLYDTNDSYFDYVTTTKKPYHIKTFSIDTQSTGHLFYTLNLPADYFAANHVLQNVGNTFRSFRGDFHILVSVQGSPQASGALVANAHYGGFAGEYSTVRTAQCEMNFKQKVILDYSDNSSTADLIVPFRYNRNGIDPFLTCSSVFFRSYVPLAGVTTVACTITVFVENQKFRFLRPTTSTVLADRLTQGLLNITTINNTMNDVIESTLPMHLEGDSVDITPSLMDAVPIALNPTPMIVKYNSMNNSDNPFPVERMSLKSSAERISDKFTYGTNMDEMNVLELMKRDNYITQLNLSTTTPTNTVAFATYVTPTLIWQNNQYGSPAEFMASNFKFWRGGLKYKLRFHMNRFQSIKLYAAMFYKDNEPTVLSDWSSSHGVVLDIGGDQREVEISIPYNAETAWLNTPYGAPQDFTTHTVQQYTLGKFAIYTISPLISPAGSPLNITMTVTMSAMDDFEFAAYQPVVSAVQGGVMLSEMSKRTPNDIVDCVPSVKTFLKRYHKFVGRRYKSDINKYKIQAVAIAPGKIATATADVELPPYGTTNLNLPYHARMPLAGLYNGFRGGVTVRLAMSYSPLTKSTPTIEKNLIPFCFYLTPDSANYPLIEDYVLSLMPTLNIYLNQDWSTTDSVAPTPFIVQPLNPLITVSGTEVIFEVDCPYQQVEKYSLTGTRAISYRNGVIVAGFYDPSIGDFGEEVEYSFNYNAYRKLSDDARLGLATIGAFKVAGPSWWGSQSLNA